MIADTDKSKKYFSATHSDDAANGHARSGGEGGIASIKSSEEFDAVRQSGNVSVVQYWAPWCKNCHKLAPGLQALAAEHPTVSFYKVFFVVALISFFEKVVHNFLCFAVELFRVG